MEHLHMKTRTQQIEGIKQRMDEPALGRQYPSLQRGRGGEVTRLGESGMHAGATWRGETVASAARGGEKRGTSTVSAR